MDTYVDQKRHSGAEALMEARVPYVASRKASYLPSPGINFIIHLASACYQICIYGTVSSYSISRRRKQPSAISPLCLVFLLIRIYVGVDSAVMEI